MVWGLGFRAAVRELKLSYQKGYTLYIIGFPRYSILNLVP